MSRCIGCGDRIPNGFQTCDICDGFVDEDPLPSDEYTAEDRRIDAMDQEAADYGDVFGNRREAA